MVKSMTGFGRKTKENDDCKVTVELKAVNHRYFEAVFRMPRQFAYLETKLKKTLSGVLKRGRVECFISFEGAQIAKHHLAVDFELADEYYRFLKQAEARYEFSESLTMRDFLADPVFLEVRESSEADSALEALVLETVHGATKRLDEMRSLEGAEIALYFKSHLEVFESCMLAVRQAIPEMEAAYKARLQERLAKLAEAEFDERMMLTELGLFLEKADINEETERLDSHLKQFYSILTQEGAVGRKLDFLIQEMNREVNTIGSKAMSITITENVVEMKTTLEKIREQVQNVE
ncbi:MULTISPECIES: YicC/YloC family endoribonuclease [Listeria]|uniref:YicC/YloC family endoribonuclease n=1 Tax=Listeria TaxID=1637 RepID=UPI000B5929FA|nr:MULTISPECIES: YicC/YloC family endoribonuclease [Listeria]